MAHVLISKKIKCVLVLYKYLKLQEGVVSLTKICSSDCMCT